jgi:hypothetical protein
MLSSAQESANSVHLKFRISGIKIYIAMLRREKDSTGFLTFARSAHL